MITRPEGGERAVLVHIQFPAEGMQEDLKELEELALSAGLISVATVTGIRKSPEARYFVGKGKAEEILAMISAHDAEVVLFNHTLSPAQERNLEKFFNRHVIDRTGLILDIFAQRARSFEGKLQVELALLKHQATRLVRGWTHLERQRGGTRSRGGPGETQLESDRRLIRNRIQLISKRLANVRQQRGQSRQARRKAVIPTIALVGYTNAGKSTLFNQLTGAEVYVENRLFATLDPTLRRIDLDEVGPLIIADTVGFIRHLPHDLIAAFRATLQEVAEADLLLHVVDASDPRRQANIVQVNEVLKTIGADQVQQILVFNKIDCVENFNPLLDKNTSVELKRICISALENIGLNDLRHAITKFLAKEMISQTLILSPAEAHIRAKLYQLKAILEEKIDEQGNFRLTIRLSKKEWEKLLNIGQA